MVSLLSCEAFKQKASLWLKEQFALHTQRRLRSVRKSVLFKSQSHLPIKEKTNSTLSSARFQAYVEDVLLKEFYSEDAVRARAKNAAIAESKTVQCMYSMYPFCLPAHLRTIHNRHDFRRGKIVGRGNA